MSVSDLGQTRLKNIAEPVRVYSVEVGKPAGPPKTKTVARERSVVKLSVTPSTKCSCSGLPPIFANGKTTI